MIKLFNLLSIIILLINFKYFQCQDVQTFKFFDIEKIKKDLFTQSDFNTSSDEKCLKELNKIASALVVSDQWALKSICHYISHSFIYYSHKYVPFN